MTLKTGNIVSLLAAALLLTWAPRAVGEEYAWVQEFLESLDENGVPPGHMLIEGDIIVPNDFFSRGTYATNTWPDGDVPYLFADNVTAANRTRMLDAMDDWEAVANIQFSLWDRGPNVIIIRDSDSNSSTSIGMSSVTQIINIKNWNKHFTLAHELAHALGFWHEQSRRDRNTYVNIRLDRIVDDKEHNFDIASSSDSYGPYDFDSVMHYNACGFSTCDDCWADFYNCRTIEVLDPCDVCWEGTIGQRDHLSKHDILAMSFLYPENNWTFVDRTQGGIGSGTFRDPYKTIPVAVGYISAGETLWVQPGEYWAANTYSKAMTIRAPLGGVLLSNADGPGPGAEAGCCNLVPSMRGTSAETNDSVESQ